MRRGRRRRGRLCECWELGTGQPRRPPELLVDPEWWSRWSRPRRRAQEWSDRITRILLTLEEVAVYAKAEVEEGWGQNRQEAREEAGKAEEEDEEAEEEWDQVQQLRPYPARGGRMALRIRRERERVDLERGVCSTGS